MRPLQIGEFTNGKGDVFPSRLIKWHVVGYIRLAGTSDHPFAPNETTWYPDVLLPAGPFDVVGGRTQTLWLDFFANDKVKSGTYRGTVRVKPVGSPATDVGIDVTVRNFSLPRSPRMKTAFSLMDGFTKHMYGRLTDRIRRSGIDIMLDHRLNPDDISRTEPPRIKDLLYARRRGMNAFNILNIVPKPKPGSKRRMVLRSDVGVYGEQFNKEFAARIDEYVKTLRQHGLTDMAYFYGFDECGSEFDAVMKNTMRFLKERYPDISTFTTAQYIYRRQNRKSAAANDHVDWYCPLIRTYLPELSDKLRKKRKQVWWYVCNVPRYPYANFSSVDFPSIEGRLLGWMTYGPQNTMHTAVPNADPKNPQKGNGWHGHRIGIRHHSPGQDKRTPKPEYAAQYPCPHRRGSLFDPALKILRPRCDRPRLARRSANVSRFRFTSGRISLSVLVDVPPYQHTNR